MSGQDGGFQLELHLLPGILRSREMNLFFYESHFQWKGRELSQICVMVIVPLQSKLLRYFAQKYFIQANVASAYFILHT